MSEQTRNAVSAGHTHTQQNGSRALARHQGQDVVTAHVPTTMQQIFYLASCIQKSGMAPKSYKSEAQIAVAIMHGTELGLKPMAALQSIANINGQPGLWGDGLLGVVRGSGLLESMREWTEGTYEEKTLTCYCEVKRSGDPDSVTASFSFEDAERAELNSKDTYKKYPRKMYKRRARSEAINDAFADLLRGIPVAEDLQEDDSMHSNVGGERELIPSDPDGDAGPVSEAAALIDKELAKAETRDDEVEEAVYEEADPYEAAEHSEESETEAEPDADEIADPEEESDLEKQEDRSEATHTEADPSPEEPEEAREAQTAIGQKLFERLPSSMVKKCSDEQHALLIEFCDELGAIRLKPKLKQAYLKVLPAARKIGDQGYLHFLDSVKDHRVQMIDESL
ncbi:hypothetical protein ACQU0X_28900 [Pseudovibrio ascidiaceicola]|uniref:hypothetical protein n=1 Tax=Pseudovibrio ascidiaceicola TaxID=285279 RepID=UPI003D35E997